MSNLKKIIIAIVMTFILALGFAVTVNASEFYRFSKVNWNEIHTSDLVGINIDQYRTASSLYCIQKGQDLDFSGKDMIFTVASIVTIDGMKATDHLGKTVEDEKENAILAYILNQEIKGNKSSDKSVNAVWCKINDWMTTVGKKLNGLSTSFAQSDEGEGADDLITKAETYANNLEKFNDGLDDLTNKGDLKWKEVDEDNDGKIDYTRIGPFDYNFDYELSDMSVYNRTSGKDVAKKNTRIFTKKSKSEFEEKGTITSLGMNELSNIIQKKKFWIGIPYNDNHKDVKKITINAQMKINKYKVKLWFLLNPTEYWQNLIRKDPSTEPKTKEKAFKYSKGGDETTEGADLLIRKVDKKDPNIKLAGVGFILKNETTQEYLIKEGQNFEYGSFADATTFYTDANGESYYTNIKPGTYTIYEVVNPNPDYKTTGSIDLSSESNLSSATSKQVEVSIAKDANGNKVAIEFIMENPKKINLKIIKYIEQAPNIKLSNIGFVIRYENTAERKYQYLSGGYTNINYVDNLDQNCVYYTDGYGEIYIQDLRPGTYSIYEVSNPYYGFDTSGTVPLTVSADGIFKNRKDYLEDIEIAEGTGTVTINAPNKQKYIKLSGYVWLDKTSGKDTERNNLYDENNIDKKFDGYKVMLCEDGEPIDYKDGTNLGDDKKWTFENVDIEKLLAGKYSIEYLYDGLTYESVEVKLGDSNGSKASEDSGMRQDFNDYFAKIEGNYINDYLPSGMHPGGKIIDDSNSISTDISYKDNGNGTVTFEHRGFTGHSGIGDGLAYEYKVNQQKTGLYAIYANTNNAGFYLKDQFSWGTTEISNINLGLYDRAQPNLAIGSDIYNVKLSINGYNHIYKYANALNNDGGFDKSIFNVGVKYGFMSGNEHVTNYTQAIYKSDYDYIDPDPKTHENHELEVYVTYVVKVKNKSGELKANVSSIVDYYDRKYEFVCASDELDKTTDLPRSDKKLNVTALNNFASYHDGVRIELDKDERIRENDTSKNYYLQFKLSRDAVKSILNGQELQPNIVEIDSYTSFKDRDGEPRYYAGIDVDSAPTDSIQCTARDRSKYQDDTHESPGLLLEVQNARTIEGIVFLDETNGEPRVGNGMYDNGEKGIGGVEIVLTETTGSGKEYKTGTESSGNDKGKFMIQGYIPGKYILTYKWGDETYTVQDYENTIYNTNRSDNPPKNTKWYKEEDPRYSDAIDNYNTKQTAPYGSRLQIDDELKNVTNTSEITRHKIESSTYPMEFDVENSITTTSNYGDKLVYEIKNIDFGIARRAEQKILLTKRIKTMKVTLENGQVIADLSIDEDPANGKRRTTGSKANVTYMEPGVNIIPENGFIKLEVDNELLQGTKLEIGYSISIKNQSELDYTNETWYKYKYDKSNLVTIKDLAVMDYLDKGWSFDKNDNPGWEIKTKDEIKNLVSKEVYEDELSTISEKQILYKEDDNLNLEPNQTQEMTLNVSKLLTTTEEISLDNETEVVKIVKTGGSKILTTPGNYVPGKGHIEPDDDMAETTIVTPSTGENQNYIMIITVVITALIILGVGVVIIKKKVINKNKADKS